MVFSTRHMTAQCQLMVEFPFSQRLKTRTEEGRVIPARNPWHYIERKFEPVEGVEPPLWIVVFADNADFDETPPDGQPKRAFHLEDGQIVPETENTEPTNDEYFVFKRGVPHSTLKFVVEHSGMANDILFGDEKLIDNTDNLDGGETFELPGVTKNLEVVDDTTTPATRTTQPTTTASTPRTPTPTPAPGDGYDLRAGTETTVEFDDTEYHVVGEIPGVDPSRFAVTTTDYDLVPPGVSRDVLALHTWQDSTWPTDWRAELDRVEDIRQDAERLELIGRALDVGWDITEILVFTAAGIPSAAIGPIVDLGTDAIAWSVKDVVEPYREAFQKLVACTKNGKDIDALASGIQSSDDLTDLMQTRIQAAVGLANNVDDVAQLGAAWGQMASALKGNAAYSASVGTALGAAKGLFVGFAISSVVNTIENVVKAKTTIHAVTYDYATLRMPVLRTLERLDEKLAAGRGTIGDVVVYDTYLRANFQMNALVTEVASRYWQAISDNVTGAVWDVLADAQKKADELARAAETQREMVQYTDLLYGNTWTETEEKLTDSINASVYGGTP
jgi:hypothetical protein